MKILFLDLDGVICTTSCYGRGTDNKWGTYRFDSKCVSTLNFIIQETGCEIILSSDWRFHYTLQEIREIFEYNGVIKGPIGFTPRSKTYTGNNLENGRSDEIKMWLEHNAWKDDVKWVAVDDLNMSENFDVHGNVIGGVKNFVHCKRENEGIKQSGIKDKILSYLK